MNQTERVADGRRRFFAASGVVSDVLIRDRKSHHDRGLERGRDYEVETGGVSLRSVPKQGTVVIILTGDRVREVDGGPAPEPASSFSAGPYRQNGVRPSPEGLTPHQSLVSIHDAADEEPTIPPETVQLEQPATPPQTAFDLDALKRALVFATRDTNDATPRTPEWQDGLAKLTAIMLAAPTLEATQSAFLDIEKYLRGQG